MMEYLKFNNETIREAVTDWLENLTKAEAKYGHISGWDTSEVTDMGLLFFLKSSFNQDISSWDVSNVTNMQMMFNHAEAFNQSLNNWDVSNVTDMGSLFCDAAAFNQPIGDWDVSKVTDMSEMFYGAKAFNQPIGNWDVSKVTSMKAMFSHAKAFNQDINSWDVSKLTNMERMFNYSEAFNQPLNNWDVSKVTNMERMFRDATAFNQPIGNWDVSKVTYMSEIFRAVEAFNQPIGNWDVSKVTDMCQMFWKAESFNQDISSWDVSKVTDMCQVFEDAKAFNQPLNNWDVSKVTNMSKMFSAATSFNQPIGNWDVSKVTNMSKIFSAATSFNQPIGDWDVSNVTNMNKMFSAATSFNQPIRKWDVNKVAYKKDMFYEAKSFNQHIVSKLKSTNKKIQKLPVWFIRRGGTLYEDGNMVVTPTTGITIQLTNVELSMYDYIIGTEHRAPHNKTTATNLRKAYNWFKKNNPKTYKLLFDSKIKKESINNKTENKLLYQKFCDKLNKQHFLNNSGVQLNEKNTPASKGEICYSDLNQKTIELLLKNKNLRICLQSNTSSYSYLTDSRSLGSSIPNEYISETEIKRNLDEKDEGFGEFLPVLTFGRKIKPEDIYNLKRGHMDISVFQDVTDWFVRLIDELEQSFIEELKEELYDSLDAPVCMATLNEFMSNIGMKAFVGHHIGDGGIGADDAINIGYTIDSDFGITSDDMMTDDMDWRAGSSLYFFNKP